MTRVFYRCHRRNRAALTKRQRSPRTATVRVNDLSFSRPFFFSSSSLRSPFWHDHIAMESALVSSGMRLLDRSAWKEMPRIPALRARHPPCAWRHFVSCLLLLSLLCVRRALGLTMNMKFDFDVKKKANQMSSLSARERCDSLAVWLICLPVVAFSRTHRLMCSGYYSVIVNNIYFSLFYIYFFVSRSFTVTARSFLHQNTLEPHITPRVTVSRGREWGTASASIAWLVHCCYILEMMHRTSTIHTDHIHSFHLYYYYYYRFIAAHKSDGKKIIINRPYAINKRAHEKLVCRIGEQPRRRRRRHTHTHNAMWDSMDEWIAKDLFISLIFMIMSGVCDAHSRFPPNGK